MFTIGGAAFAQIVANPNDRLYTDLELWQNRGLIGSLPPLRPYPLQLVKKVLGDVVERGNEADQELARMYLGQMGDGNHIHAVISSLARTDTNKGYAQVGVEGSMQGSLVPSISYSTLTGIVAVQGSGNEALPEFGRTDLDFVNDGSVHAIGPTGLTPRMSMVAGTALGNESTYFQAGVLRASFGPFWGDNAILSPFSPQSGHFSLTLQQGSYTVTMALMEISGTTNSGGTSDVPTKFMALNGLELYPTDWLTLGIFESVIWGPRFEPLYLLPVISFYAQGMGGYSDNSFIGISGGIKFPGAVKADFILYFDDASFNDMLRLHFNTMMVLSFQAGASWTPNLPFLTRLSANILLVTPYTYTHKDGDNLPTDDNYVNYTNAGQNIGPSIQPDSARFEVSALLRPVPYLDLNVFSRLTLHGNASDGVGGGNGTLFDDGYVNGKASFAPGYPLPAGLVYTRFLTQSTLEKSVQAGIDAKLNLDTPIGHVQVSLGYTLQYILNVDLTSSNALDNFLSLGVVFTY
jgi:hypothetical protein